MGRRSGGQAESQAFLSQAFAAALGLMFIILLAQFNSVYNAVLVLLAVVLSTTGVLIGMLVMDQTFSIIMTGTGIVALAGIVVNNNIVLIDTYQEYSRYMPRIEAITRTAEARIRPVLLTTITTMAGLAPMMFGISLDFGNGGYTVDSPTALWWKQLATAVVFGLGIATVLTLVVTPSLLALRIWWARSWAGSPAASRAWARPRQPHRAGLGAGPRRAPDPRPGDLLGRGARSRGGPASAPGAASGAAMPRLPRLTCPRSPADRRRGPGTRPHPVSTGPSRTVPSPPRHPADGPDPPAAKPTRAPWPRTSIQRAASPRTTRTACRPARPPPSSFRKIRPGEREGRSTPSHKKLRAVGDPETSRACPRPTSAWPRDRHSARPSAEGRHGCPAPPPRPPPAP
jgi:hypothetical protein